MSQSPLHLQVYLNLYKVCFHFLFHLQSLLEEVDSNHIPESAKDAVVNCILERTDKWMSRFYSLLQEDSITSLSFSLSVPLSLKESIILSLSYTLFSCTLPSLYSFPDASDPERSFLSLLLQLSLHHPHTSLRCYILSLLSRLLELGSFPVHPLFHSAVRLVYASLLQLCDAAMRGDFAEQELFEVVRAVTTLGGVLFSFSSSARGEVGDGPFRTAQPPAPPIPLLRHLAAVARPRVADV